jgi:hypothetical protein
LAIAYNRVGRREDAKHEAALQKAAQDRIDQQKQQIPNVPQGPATGPEGQKPEPHQ